MSVIIETSSYSYSNTFIKQYYIDAGSPNNLILGEGWTSIDSNVFENNEDIISITLPLTLINIGDGSFYNAMNLIQVQMAISPSYIGNGAFDNTRNLETFYIVPSNPIGRYLTQDDILFDNVNESLIKYPVKKINVSNQYVIPSFVKNIGEQSFANVVNLSSITIPSTVINIEDNAFIRIWGLTKFIVDNNNQHYSSHNDILYNKQKTKLISYPINKTDSLISIPNTVTNVIPYAFYNATNVTKIVIPESISYIHSYTFSYINNLTDIEVVPENNNYSSESNILFNKDKTILIKYPIGIQDSSYIIPYSVTSIAKDAFKYTTKLNVIRILDSVTHIGIDTFIYTHLTTVIISSTNALSISSPNPNVLFYGKEVELIEPLPSTITAQDIDGNVGKQNVIINVISNSMGSITYSSADENIVSISSNGLISFNSIGNNIIITINQSNDVYYVSSTCTASINISRGTPIISSQSDYYFSANDTPIYLNPTSTSSGNFRFTSQNNNCVEIDSVTGELTYKSNGSVEIQVIQSETDLYISKTINISIYVYDYTLLIPVIVDEYSDLKHGLNSNARFIHIIDEVFITNNNNNNNNNNRLTLKATWNEYKRITNRYSGRIILNL